MCTSLGGLVSFSPRLRLLALRRGYQHAAELRGLVRPRRGRGRGPHPERQGEGRHRRLQTDQPQHDGSGSGTKTNNISSRSFGQAQYTGSHPRFEQVRYGISLCRVFKKIGRKIKFVSLTLFMFFFTTSH